MRLIGEIKTLTENVCTLEIYAGRIDESLKDCEVVAEVSKYKAKRSLSANAYFWVLVDKISRAIGVGKDSVYKMLLREAGVFVTMQVIEDAIPTLQKTFRVIDQLDQIDGMVEVACYFGTSTYNSAEMAHIIDVARQQAIDLGCDVWEQEEINALLEAIDEKDKRSK